MAEMNAEKTYISVVIPIYCCKESLYELCRRLSDTLSKVNEHFEIVLVNDACPQGSWDTIVDLCETDHRIKAVNLSRNFGQHHAITAGLDITQGRWVVVMDGDLQDPPEEILKLYNKAQEGYDVVNGRRVIRNDYFFTKLLSKSYHRVFSYLTGKNTNSDVANFGIYSNKVISNFRRMREQHRMLLLSVIWLGFKRTEIDISHAEREVGNSSYNLSKKLSMALDSIITHTNKPLKLFIKLGFLMSGFSIFYAGWVVFRYVFLSIPVEGWTSLIVSMYFLSGLLLASIGMLGLYIDKIFDEVKDRPLYIVDKYININPQIESEDN